MKQDQATASAGHVISLEKSARYWLRRADQHRKKGEYHRAAALLRHAVALEPASGELRREYAETLRDMSCYEASNRAAFDALALEPSGFEPYHIIGRNMLSLGREQEAIDAFSHYLQQARTMPNAAEPWDDDDELYDLENLLDVQPSRGTARYEALVHIASLRLAREDIRGAHKALARAQRQNYTDARLYSLQTMYFEAIGRPQDALPPALLAARQSPTQVPALCALASVRIQLGQRGLAASAMLKAALHCYFPYQEQLFCFTSTALGLPDITLAMLRLNRRRNADRLPTLFNLAVVLFAQGKEEEATAHLHRCRDLDPEDICVQYVFQTVMDWEQNETSAAQRKAEAAQLSFYPFLPQAAEQRLLEMLADHLTQGLPAFSAAIQQDSSLYRAFLYAVSMPASTLGRLLPAIAAQLAQTSPATAEVLLRNVLWQASQNNDTKHAALSTLIAMGSTPPYGLWQNGRIVQVNPLDTVRGKPASVIQRLLVRRIRVAQSMLDDPQMTSFALSLLYRMTRGERYAFAADVGHVWRTALVKLFSLFHGYDPSVWDDGTLSPELQKREQKAFVLLHKLAQPEHNNH